MDCAQRKRARMVGYIPTTIILGLILWLIDNRYHGLIKNLIHVPPDNINNI